MLIGIGAGTGAIVVAGVAALAEHGSPRRLGPRHQLGDKNSPTPTPTPTPTPNTNTNTTADAKATITSGELTSTHMGRSVGWTISTPSRPAQAVIFCLHGFGGDHHFAFDGVHLPDVVESGQAPLAVAAVDGGPDSYWHPRADGTDAMAMLLDEFIPFVERRTRTSRRALVGWSMGGYGSLLAAETVPDRFFAVAAASPALWNSPGQTAPGAFDNAADYHRFDVFAEERRLAGLTIRVDCGTSDPFYQANRRFVAALPPGHQGSFGPGAHNVAFWSRVAPAQVATIADALHLRS